jgi:ribosomal protein L19E
MGKKVTALAQIDAIVGKSKKKGGKKGGGSRKIGRYAKSPSSQRYKSEKRWLSNKLKRLERHLRYFPNDNQAHRALTAKKAA